MQFKIAAAAVLASVASAIAQASDFLSISIPADVDAGSATTITWAAPAAKYAGQAVTISLIGGQTQNTQVPLQDIGSANTNDLTFSWTVPATLGDVPFYGIVIKLTSDPTNVFQYSNPFSIEAETVATTSAAATSADAYGVKTVSLSSHAAAYTAPAGGYTKVVEVVETTTVPCTNSTTPVSVYVPPAATYPVVSKPVVQNPYNNATFSTAVVPPATTAPSSPYAPTTTPVSPVTGAGARFAAPLAVIGGLFVAALAL